MQAPNVHGVSVGNFLAHHDTHPLTLVGALLSALGAEWVLWEPETLRDSIAGHFNRSEISTLNWEKIQAARTCIASSSPWKSWSAFTVCAQPINNNIVDFQTLQPPTPAQCCFAVHVMNELGDHGWDDEVERYIAASFLAEDITYLPPPVEFAQDWVSEKHVKCLSCGWVGDDLGQPACWACGSRKLEHYVERDPTHVRARYDHIVAQGEDHDLLTEETGEDVQTAKLLVIRGYLEHRQKQLDEQVRLLNVSPIPSRRDRR